MKKLTMTMAALVIAALGTPAYAAPCRDAHGKFIECATAAPVKKAPCKDAKGRFTKCPAKG